MSRRLDPFLTRRQRQSPRSFLTGLEGSCPTPISQHLAPRRKMSFQLRIATRHPGAARCALAAGGPRQEPLPPQDTIRRAFRSELCSGTEAGSFVRRIDSCITQLKAQGPSRTCNESKEEEDEAFRSLSIEPSLPLRASPLQTIPEAQVRKPSLSLRAPSLHTILHAQVRKASLPLGAPSLQSILQVRKASLSLRAPSLQSILQVRKPPTVCAKARQSDTPDQPFRSVKAGEPSEAEQRRRSMGGDSAMRHRGVAPVDTASFSRRSPLSRPATEAIFWLSSPASALRTGSFRSAALWPSFTRRV